MTTRVVLDAGAFDALDHPNGGGLRLLIRRALIRGGQVRCSAVTLAEVARGTSRTRRVEAAVARDRGGQRVGVVPTDLALAKLVGAVLHEGRRGSEDMADAHVVAVCAGAEHALVVTTDPGDILALAPAIRGTRVGVVDPWQTPSGWSGTQG